MAPSIAITDLVDSLSCPSPHDALLTLAHESERIASILANELSSSLDKTGTKTKISNTCNKSNTLHGGRGGIPLPKSLLDAPIPTNISASTTDGTNKSSSETTPSRALHRLNPSHPLTHATMASESILSSLSKIASGGWVVCFFGCRFCPQSPHNSSAHVIFTNICIHFSWV